MVDDVQPGVDHYLDIVHHPLSDLFVTFNEVRDTFAGIALDRTLTVKVTRLLQY